VVLSQNGIRARSGLNRHFKHLKITTAFTVRTLSPYKDYSSLLRWQANLCVYIATTELHQRWYVVDFLECSTYFVVGDLWLFVAFCRTIRTYVYFLFVYESLVVCAYFVGD
jgi:hypothetical protein